MNKKFEASISIFAAILSCFAIYYSYNANRIAKENFNPFLKIEYMTVKGYSNFFNLWNPNENSNSLISTDQKKDIGIENILWKIETENVKILFDEDLFKNYLEKNHLFINDSILKKLNFEIVHIKNVSNAVAKNIRLEITETDDFEVVNEFKIDAALNNESIILLSKIYFINEKNDTIIIGPKAILEKIKYDGYDKNLERKNRERFKNNHVIKSINGNSLIAQCPFIYSNQSGQWILENAIIVGCNNKKKEKMTQIKLSNFDGKIKILEIEKETSFIDQIFIQVIYNNNDTIIYRPTEKCLIKDDKSYLVLDQHESTIIDFTPDFITKRIKDITLFAKGFYEPY